MLKDPNSTFHTSTLPITILYIDQSHIVDTFVWKLDIIRKLDIVGKLAIQYYLFTLKLN